jgi:hypothetical protein
MSTEPSYAEPSWMVALRWIQEEAVQALNSGGNDRAVRLQNIYDRCAAELEAARKGP